MSVSYLSFIERFPKKFRTGLSGPVRFLHMRWFSFLLILRDSRLELPFGRFEWVENENAPLLGAYTRGNTLSKDKELPNPVLQGVSGLYNFLFLKHERNEMIENFFCEVFPESADVDIFPDMREYPGETDGEARGDFSSTRELKEVNDLPVVSRSSGGAHNVVVSGHEGFFIWKVGKELFVFSNVFRLLSSSLIFPSETR